MQCFTTVGDVLVAYLGTVSITKKSERSDRTRSDVLLRDTIAKVPLADLKRSHVRELRNRILDVRCASGSTWNRYNALLGSALKWAQVEHDAGPGRSVCTGLNQPENAARTRRLRPGEWEQLLGAVPLGHWLRPFLIVAVESGMRRGEICSLRWDRIEILDGGVGIAHLLDTKNGDARDVPLSSTALAALLEFRGPLPRVGLVFGVEPEMVTKAFLRLVDRAEIKDLRLHDLRAEAISRLAERGWNLADVKAVSGHRSAVVMRYLRHADPKGLARKLG